MAAIAVVCGVAVAVIAHDIGWALGGLVVVVLVVTVVAARSAHNQVNALAERATSAGAQPQVLRYEPGEPLDLLRRDVQRDVSALLVLNRIAPPTGAVPAPGGWAATPDTLLLLVDRVLAAETAPLVVECGSGTSTVWIALALRSRGAGRLVSLENDPDYAAATRAALSRLGLSDWVDVRYAPLTSVPVGDADALWYSPEAVTDLSGITLLFVDGPPAHFGPQMRFPAVPLLAARLAAGALVVLDDIDRPDEQAVATAWTERSWGGASFRRAGGSDRAVLLETVR
ncbi:class I SAM-dependent methyltransferase [Leifsonia aquatica]|uniref:class I SAM-dependent methyltransferase n=1 Tax=Leifsonia aquatica TaxID=144185 RepID=UPI00046A72EE|nr:class I SAM-dependent methyltransferase [Leifsonia aquatica]